MSIILANILERGTKSSPHYILKNHTNKAKISRKIYKLSYHIDKGRRQPWSLVQHALMEEGGWLDSFNPMPLANHMACPN